MVLLKPCIYCVEPADSKEHPLPAALGEFEDGPMLLDKICRTCNTKRLGILDEQLSRCGPEGFLRNVYGVQGRSTNNKANSFYRPSAGGRRLEMKAHDPQFGFEVLYECTNGAYRQMRQLVFVQEDESVKHLPIREGIEAEDLRSECQRLNLRSPYNVHLVYDPATEGWVEPLIKQAFPAAQFGDGTLGSKIISNAVINISVTDRYFRALAKIGFHYFLTQFPEYTGHDRIFSDIVRYIGKDGGNAIRANEFIGVRQHPLLGEMMTPGVRPMGWRCHVVCAEINPGELIAHVQLFVSEDWASPAYTVRLARDQGIFESRSAAHAYVYYPDGSKQGKYVGKAEKLESIRSDSPALPTVPVIAAAE